MWLVFGYAEPQHGYFIGSNANRNDSSACGTQWNSNCHASNVDSEMKESIWMVATNNIFLYSSIYKCSP